MIFAILERWLLQLRETDFSFVFIIFTKYGLCVPLHDVINFAKFPLYRANSVWVAAPQKLGVPLTWEVTFTNARALPSFAMIVDISMFVV